jgi:outer membrane receptor protein involved in Fe transport
MAWQSSQARRAPYLAALLGTGSFLALASMAAHAADAVAPAAAAAPVEEVLITGSLIQGAAAVGVPVTVLGQEDFERTGAITVADMLKQVPGISVDLNVSVNTTSGGNRQRLQNTTIHGLSSGTAVYALLMIDGRRYPAQGTNLQNLDPSIIPTLAVERLDVLAAGASATYGSDAVSGVFNIILKHNYDGAISNARVSWSTDFGWEGRTIQASQLFGRTWDEWAGMGKGSIALTYEWWDKSRIYGQGRDYYTTNMEPWGYDDRTFMGMNIAGIISTGNPASATGIPARRSGDTQLFANLGTHFCDNCFSVPAGTGTSFQNFGAQTSQVSWATVLANKGVKTQIIPELYSWMNPKQANNAFVATFDQEILPDVFGLGPVSLFVTGFYQNRRGSNAYIPGYSPCTSCITPANGLTVPTTNPYFPTGVPAGTVVRAHFTVTPNFIPFSDNFIIDRQLQFGFKLDELPFDWQGTIFGSLSETHANDHNNGINANNLSAALGNTIASQAASGLAGPRAAYTKPATLPFLNPFCDRSQFQCDSPGLLAYITSQRLDDSVYHEREYGANFSGPVFDLPGGPLAAAVGFGLLRQSFHVVNDTTETTFSNEILSHSYQFNKYRNWSATGQLNIPVFGPDFNFPGAEGLVIDLGYRVDKYDEFGWVKTPKIGVNWLVGFGLTGRAAYGTSFTAPGFGNVTDYQGVRSTNELFNSADTRSVSLALNCPSVASAGIVAGTVSPGSLQAVLNPQRFGCPAVPALGLPAGPPDPGTVNSFNSFVNPVGLQLNVSLDFLQGKSLEPEHSKQWSLGLNWTPRPDDPIVGVLAGLSLDAEYWHIKLEDRIGTLNVGGSNLATSVNDPKAIDLTQPVDIQTADMFATRYLVAPRPDLPTTAPQNAAFKAFVDEIVARGKCLCNPAALTSVKFIDISGIANTGWTERAGIDMRVRYDMDIGNLGTLGLSASAALETRNRSRNPGGPIVDTTFSHVDRTTGVYTGANSGSHITGTRFVVSWTDPEGHWVVAPDFQYIPHSNSGTTLPACFWHPDFGPGNPASTPYGGLCYPGAPFWEQPRITYAPGTAAAIANQEQRWAGLYHPAEVFANLSVSYNTLDMPTNSYLQNIRIAVNVINVANRVPRLGYDPRTSSGSARVRGGGGGDDMQRQVSVSLTKAW